MGAAGYAGQAPGAPGGQDQESVYDLVQQQIKWHLKRQ